MGLYERFKSFCRDHEISVGTITGLFGFIAFTASGIVSQVGSYDYSGLPTWAQSAVGFGLLGLVIVGRFASTAALWLGKLPSSTPTPSPAPTPEPAPVDATFPEDLA